MPVLNAQGDRRPGPATTITPSIPSCPEPQNTSQLNTNRPALFGVNASRVGCPGTMSARRVMQALTGDDAAAR
jgi:hypothetical protein